MNEQNYQPEQTSYTPQPEGQSYDQVDSGPRSLSLFTLFVKTFAGLGGGLAGALVLVIIFLAASSFLQPLLGGIEQFDQAGSGTISPLFLFALIGMIFATSLISSMIGCLLIAYTERDRYIRISTSMGQIFIFNFIILLFMLPIFLATSISKEQQTGFFIAAGMHIILSSMASILILEVLHDAKYPLLAVYKTVLGMLTAIGINTLLYIFAGNPTILAFAALPVIWASLGFFQAFIPMIYRWVWETWGVDYLATESSLGTDYGVPDESEEEEEEQIKPDVEGTDFLRQ